MSKSPMSIHNIVATGDSKALSAVIGGVDVNMIDDVSMCLNCRVMLRLLTAIGVCCDLLYIACVVLMCYNQQYQHSQHYWIISVC